MKVYKHPLWKRRLPNVITLSRIAFVPPVVVALCFDTLKAGVVAAAFFIAASLSDFFDGYFARNYQAESLLGKFLDPVADKLLVTAALIMLIPLDRVSALLVLLLLSRDILINGLRAVAASRNIVIGAGWVGKWKTGAQMTAIPMLMIKVPLLGAPTLLVGQILLWVSLALSLYSGADYLWAFFKDYKEEV